MGMPSGDSPAHAQAYYQYLQAHQQTMQNPATWHVRWLDLAWMWGFVLVLALTIIWWIWQNRSTRQRAGIYPVDDFGGYTTELAGPATWFFLLLTAVLAGFAVVLIVGHIVWGQKF
jgi:phosphoglycerol transferase MdoB-like AlkP superfamily enzyme